MLGETLAPLRSEGVPEADVDDVASDVEGRFISNFHDPEAIALSAVVTHPCVAERFLREASRIDRRIADDIIAATLGIMSNCRAVEWVGDKLSMRTTR